MEPSVVNVQFTGTRDIGIAMYAPFNDSVSRVPVLTGQLHVNNNGSVGVSVSGSGIEGGAVVTTKNYIPMTDDEVRATVSNILS